MSPAGLLSQIQDDALDDSVAVATALRKCLVLGGETGSAKLRDWARHELEGYAGADPVPDYRVIHAPLKIDGIAGNYQVTGEQIAPTRIPDFAREVVSERLELRYGVGSLEGLLQQADIKLQPPGASDLVRLMNAQDGTMIMSLYWGVSHAAIHGVLDQVRTALTRLVVELKDRMGDKDVIPDANAANQAVNIVIGQDSTVQITTAQAAGVNASATATGSQTLPTLLAQLEDIFRRQGDGEAAEKVAHLATLAESADRDESKIRRLWSAIKVAATTNEAITLVGHIAPLLGLAAHH
jgi:AbiTii